ncbi:GerAB/ArcD/ProY family transporter [Salipaludibacillus sp. CF4.18]|uniref:GerAB/ArcD/ProY family transporter n=1 Tax=Salipaludibacillus sp. CF4.18 TaxID=3373081 RepID=UPI003EE4BDE4
MERAKITPFQLFSLIFLFELGTAIVLAPGIEASQNAWIAILLGLSTGIVIFLIYYYLFRQFPNLSLIEYLPKILGKYLGWFVGFMYTLYFLYQATRILRDFGDLILTSILPETPLMIVNLLMICVIIYVIYLGIEVLARTGEFFVLIFLLLGIFTNLLFLFSGEINIENLLPILEEGWTPVLGTFPWMFTFPFGEMIIFTMLLPYLNNKNAALKVGITGLVISGVLIAFATTMNIAVLGVDIAERSTFPLISAISKIRIGEFLERLDAIAVLSLIIGVFFKIALFFYVGVLGTSMLFKVSKYKQLLLPMSILVSVGSISVAENVIAHAKEGSEIVPLYLHLPFQVYIPVLLLIIILIRKRFFGD